MYPSMLLAAQVTVVAIWWCGYLAARNGVGWKSAVILSVTTSALMLAQWVFA